MDRPGASGLTPAPVPHFALRCFELIRLAGCILGPRRAPPQGVQVEGPSALSSPCLIPPSLEGASSRLGEREEREPDREPSGPGEEMGSSGRSTVQPRMSNAKAAIKSYFTRAASDIGFISAAARLSQGVPGGADAVRKQVSQARRTASVGLSKALLTTSRCTTVACRGSRREGEREILNGSRTRSLCSASTCEGG